MKRKGDQKTDFGKRVELQEVEIEFADPEKFAPLDKYAEKLLVVMREFGYPMTFKQLVKHSQLSEQTLYQSTVLLKLHDLIEDNIGPKDQWYFQLTEKGKRSPKMNEKDE